MASIHCRSSPGTCAATGFGCAKVLPRFVEFVAVTLARVRLVRARLGTPEVGKLTAKSTSPPPSPTPTVLHPVANKPQLSGRPKYLNGSVPFAWGGPS